MGALATISGAQGVMAPYASFSLSINGIAVDAPSIGDDTKSTMNKQYSAIALASQINEKTSLTNVKAEVQTNTVTIWNTELSANTFTIDSNFQINDVTISASNINSAQKFVDAVNSFSNSTGVKAKIRDGSADDIDLYAEDGRNIEIQMSSQAIFSFAASETFAAALFGDNQNRLSVAAANILSGTYTGGTALALVLSGLSGAASFASFVRTGAIRLVSSQDINISGPTDTSILGFAGGAYAVNPNSAINLVDLSSQSGATEAINVADAALKQITNLRANLGAIQNRLDSTTNNIGVMLENISAARSQIRDADIAEETAELTRAQILQQAGVAVLGQANSASQIALSLLRF
jgi:flagellin